MNRRTLLTMGAGAAAFLLAGHKPAHADLEPDRMWSVYRRYRLMILGQRDDEVALSLASSVVDVLARHLPDSRAQLARAHDTRRIGVLIGTNQQDVAIMSADSAKALFSADPPFGDIVDVPLRIISSFGRHVLVCRTDLAARHAWLVAQTLAAHSDSLPVPAGIPKGIVPTHEGSRAFYIGEAIPESAGTG